MEETSMRQNKKKVLVIGFDGATFNLLTPWIKDGQLPIFAQLIGSGVHTNLKSVLPMRTAPSWSSIVTGKNPGKHGIFDFTARKKNEYNFTLLNASFRKGKDIWQIISGYRRKVIVVNVPFTYPPREVNGCIIPGFLTPSSADEWIYPPSLAQELSNKIGKFNIHLSKAYIEGKEEEFLQEIHRITDKIAVTTFYLMKRFEWDFFMVVFYETDIVQHRFWKYLDPSHPHYIDSKARSIQPLILEFYKKLDALVGSMINVVDSHTSIMILSDHGFGPNCKRVYLNRLLINMRHMKIKNNYKTSIKRILFKLGINPNLLYKYLLRIRFPKLQNFIEKADKEKVPFSPLFLSLRDVDWANTKAFAPPGQGGIFINLKGREPCGAVEPGYAYEKTREEIIRELSILRDPVTGNRVFESVLKKEQVYSGEFVDNAPDIVLLPNKTFSIFPQAWFGSKSWIGEPVNLSGMHDMNGILIMYGYPFKKGKTIDRACLYDIAPTILYLLGISIPRDVDGEVLIQAIDEDFLNKNKIVYESCTRLK